jgi:hypothetical protein
MDFHLQQWNRMSGKNEFDILQCSICIVVIRFLGRWVQREAAETGSIVHEPSSFFCLCHQHPQWQAVDLQQDLCPLFLKGSAERKWQVGQQQLQESIKICQNTKKAKKNENYVFSTYSYGNEWEVACNSLFSPKKAVIHSCLVQVMLQPKQCQF